jgi:hypothetical protein
VRARAAIFFDDDLGLRLVIDDPAASAHARALALSHLLRSAEVTARWLTDAERLLISFLDTSVLSGDADLGVEVARALSLVGGADAIAPLSRLASSSRVGTACSSAAAAIRARLTDAGASPGQLEIADVPSSEGALSAPAAAGALALALAKKS